MIPVVAPEGEPCALPTRRLLRLVHDVRRRARAVLDQRVHAAECRDVLGVRAGTYLPADLTDAAAAGRGRGRPPDGLRPGDRRLRAGARAEAARDPARRALRRLHRGLRALQRRGARLVRPAPDGAEREGGRPRRRRGGPLPFGAARRARQRRGRAGRRRPSARSGRRSACPDARWRSRRGRRGRRSAACRGRRPGCPVRGRSPRPSSATATSTPSSSRLARDVHVAGPLAVAIRVQRRRSSRPPRRRRRWRHGRRRSP